MPSLVVKAADGFYAHWHDWIGRGRSLTSDFDFRLNVPAIIAVAVGSDVVFNFFPKNSCWIMHMGEGTVGAVSSLPSR
jgi:hypothetical protein